MGEYALDRTWWSGLLERQRRDSGGQMTDAVGEIGRLLSELVQNLCN